MKRNSLKRKKKKKFRTSYRIFTNIEFIEKKNRICFLQLSNNNKPQSFKTKRI